MAASPEPTNSFTWDAGLIIWSAALCGVVGPSHIDLSVNTTVEFFDIIFAAALMPKAKEKSASERQQLRFELSRPILTRIEGLLMKYLHAITPGSLMGKALHYLSAQWPKLIRYVENGAWPIDNNICENAIRPFVVGRRNWLFADTVAGANASANLYSLVETCKANGIDPYVYLVSLLRNLPAAKTADDFEVLLPWRMTPGA